MTDVVPALSGLSSYQFQGLADVPPELEGLGNIVNPTTCPAYQNDVAEFSRFAGQQSPVELGRLPGAHVIVWRKDMKTDRQIPLHNTDIIIILSFSTNLFDKLNLHPHNLFGNRTSLVR
jgi:hypothetical protein